MTEQAIDLALGVPAQSEDGPYGRVEHVIIDPETGAATHVVVRESVEPRALRLIPRKYVAAADAQSLRLAASVQRLTGLREYIQTDYYPPSYFVALARAEQCKLPLAPSGWTVEHPATPEGYVALAGHEPVLATDGKVGRVDGVLVDRHTGRVSHLLLRKGHLWGAREVQVPAGLVARYEDGDVVLSVDKAAVGALPDVHEG